MRSTPKGIPMCRIRSLLFASLLAGTALSALAAVGHVEAAHGEIAITRLDGSQVKARSGADIDQGDLLVSGSNAWAVLAMVDGASLTVRPNTRFRIDEYRNGENGGTSSIALSLLKGALRSITGLIGKQDPAAYRLSTPTATIGIRGTDHETVVVEDDTDYRGAQPGTYDTVNAGETVLRGAKGDIAVLPGAVGFLHRNGQSAPAVLKSRPRFFERIALFANRQGIDKVLGRLHQPLGNGAFGAHPDLRERLEKAREARQANKAGELDQTDAKAGKRGLRKDRKAATDANEAGSKPHIKGERLRKLHQRG